MAQQMKTSQGLVLRAGGARKSGAERILRCNYCKMEAPISQGGHMIRNHKGEIVCPMLLEKERNQKQRKLQKQQKQSAPRQANTVRFSAQFRKMETETQQVLKKAIAAPAAPLKTSSRFAALIGDDSDDENDCGTGLVLKVAAAPKVTGAWSRVSKSQVRSVAAPVAVTAPAPAAAPVAVAAPARVVPAPPKKKSVTFNIENDFDDDVVAEEKPAQVVEKSTVDFQSFLGDVADCWDDEMENDANDGDAVAGGAAVAVAVADDAW